MAQSVICHFLNNRFCQVLLILLLSATFSLWSQVGFGSEPTISDSEVLIKQKMPAGVMPELEAGRYQDLIVEFEHRDIQEEAAARRLARRLRFNDHLISAFKKTRYRERKSRIFDAFKRGDLNIIQDYKHLPLSFVRVKSKKALERLANRPEIKSIRVNTALYHHLFQSLPFINYPDMCACEYGGSNAVVAVLDTGVDYTRAAFGSCANPGDSGCKVVLAEDIAPQDNSPDASPVLHGTNVAGIVLGVAPDSGIAAVDVFTGDLAWTSDILKGINWVIAQKTVYAVNMVAMNLSLGGPASSDCTSSGIRTAVQDARAEGIMTIASSGNDALTDQINFPACIPEVVSVGAVYDNNYGSEPYSVCTDPTTAPDQVPCFSNSSAELDLLAPGARVKAAGRTLTGTSQAAPHVSGAVALLRSAFPGDSLDDTLSRMQNDGVPVTDNRNSITKPRLSFQATCTASDQDDDCAADVSDNCPEDANPDQEDRDKDGIGDVCDTCPDDPYNDLDGDSICGDVDPDDDGDGMPDAWEESYEGLNPLIDDAGGDLDSDGYTNLEEYKVGTSPADDTSLPIEAMEIIPHQNAGVDPDQTRVPSDTSFSIHIYSAAGINITDSASIEFTINDGTQAGYNPYARAINDSSVVRIVKQGSDPDTAVVDLWAVYDRSKEASYGNYAYEADVSIKVDVQDKNGTDMPQAGFDFRIESETEHDQAQFFQPDSGPVDPGDPGLTGPYDAGIQVNSGSMEGAKIFFDNGEPITPRFGPVNELPELNVTGEEIVGIAMNLQPPNVFSTPVKLMIPCPGYTDVSRIKLYLYHGTSWAAAMDENGNVLPGGIDFIKPNTRVNHNNGAPSAIEVQVYHFTGIQAVNIGPAAAAASAPAAVSSSSGGGGGCFIGTIK